MAEMRVKSRGKTSWHGAFNIKSNDGLRAVTELTENQIKKNKENKNTIQFILCWISGFNMNGGGMLFRMIRIKGDLAHWYNLDK